MQTVLISLNEGEFAALITEAVVAALQQQATNTQTINPPKTAQKPPLRDDVMLSRADCRNLFKTSLTTIDAWARQKRLQSVKIGGRRYFRQSDVEKLFEQKGVKRG